MKHTLLKPIIKRLSTFFFILCLYPAFGQTLNNFTIHKKVVPSPTITNQYDVTLSLVGPKHEKTLETTLLVDISSRMQDPSGGGESIFDYAKKGIINYIDYFFSAANNPTGRNKLSIITYSSTANVVLSLSGNNSAQYIENIKREVNGLNPTSNASQNLKSVLTVARKQFVDYVNYI